MRFSTSISLSGDIAKLLESIPHKSKFIEGLLRDYFQALAKVEMDRKTTNIEDEIRSAEI